MIILLSYAALLCILLFGADLKMSVLFRKNLLNKTINKTQQQLQKHYKIILRI